MTDWLNRCHFGDVRAVLRAMAADGVKVQTIVTSPPYWGLRSYLPAGHADKVHEIGSEPTLQLFIAGMVEVFDLCRDVLADDGTMWVNMGDSYATGSTPGFKSKDLLMQPHRLAIALQDAGWWVRQDNVWHKPNPMPESTRDRCTKAHEFVFLLAKSERYYYDFEAMQEPVSGTANARRAKPSNGVGFGYAEADPKPRTVKTPTGWDTGPGGHRGMVGRYQTQPRTADDPQPGAGRRPPGEKAAAEGNDSAYADGCGARMGREPGWRKLAAAGSGIKLNESYDAAIGSGELTSTRNRRSVWTVPSEPFSGAHFATFPTKLIEPCILAGCPVGGTVLDIFFGSGTTGQVAQALGRNFIGIELNRANEPLQTERLRQPSLNLEAA